MRNTRRKFNHEERIRIVSEIQEKAKQGITINAASKALGISPSQYQNWKIVANPRGGKRVKKMDLSGLMSESTAADTYSVAIIGMPTEIADIIKQVLG